MSTYSTVIVGYDGSESARDGVAVAGLVAVKLGVPVTAVTAWKPSIELPGSRELDWAQRMTKASDIDLTAAGVRDVELVQAKGDPADVLISSAASRPESLIVAGAHGLESASSRVFGSTSNQLSHKSENDVLFVRNRVQEFASVALATDGSETSLTAVRRGYEFANGIGAQVSLITVADSVTAGNELLEEVERKLRETYPDAAVELLVKTGHAADELSTGTSEFDLVVLGNRGMSGFARVLGSTANSVTHHASTNLLLVNTTRG